MGGTNTPNLAQFAANHQQPNFSHARWRQQPSVGTVNGTSSHNLYTKSDSAPLATSFTALTSCAKVIIASVELSLKKTNEEDQTVVRIRL